MSVRASVSSTPFGHTTDGRPVEMFTLTVPGGHELRAITYGGIVVSLRVPDRHGEAGDVVLGHDTLAGYLERPAYFGAIIGRYANRIGEARFSLCGQEHALSRNEGRHHLHGGIVGFDKVVWDAAPFTRDDAAGIVFSHRSPDGDQGYPGNLEVHVTLTLNDRAELVLFHEARTDRPTPVSLTHHSYFDLTAGASPDVLDHVLTLQADRFTPVDDDLIPTGEIAAVTGTPFDFRQPTTLRARIGEPDEQLRRGQGYDHNFVLSRADDGLAHAARVVEPKSGRTLDVFTTEPGLQLYSGNQLDGTITGKGGRVYGRHRGFCLEPQHFPDSPNRAGFPPTVLRPGEEYRSRSVYAFGVAE